MFFILSAKKEIEPFWEYSASRPKKQTKNGLVLHFRAIAAHSAILHFSHVFIFVTQRHRGGSGAEFIDRLLATSRSRRLAAAEIPE
ncbi:MAG: hypothetical protein IJS46_02265, partial [Kiritimatiellae bacterium]|nr:hypothetical protein [Kiritimatiellia bacterium]